MDTFFAFFLSYFIEAIIFWIYSDAFFPTKFSTLSRAVALSCSYTVLLFFPKLNRIKFNFIFPGKLHSSISFL